MLIEEDDDEDMKVTKKISNKKRGKAYLDTIKKAMKNAQKAAILVRKIKMED